MIRDAVDRIGSEDTGGRRARAVAAVGGFHSGQADGSARHDDYLDDAFGQ